MQHRSRSRRHTIIVLSDPIQRRVYEDIHGYFINEVYEVLSDPVHHRVYSDIHGYSLTSINSFADDSTPNIYQLGGVKINEDTVIDKSIHKYINSHSAILKELTHLRFVTVLMTFIMVVFFLPSIATVRRILMATFVFKVAAKVIGEVEALIVFIIIPYGTLAVF
ncbi:hypothetical protein RYX36_034881 [Vicia faba]